MQSFHNNRLLHVCLLHAHLLYGCDVTYIASIGRFATSISLREHANKRYAKCLVMNWCSKHLIIINNPTQNDYLLKLKILSRYIIIRLLNSYSVLGPRSLVGLITRRKLGYQIPTKELVPKTLYSFNNL